MRSSSVSYLLGVSILALTSGCFGARPTLRSYYVLHGQPDSESGTLRTLAPERSEVAPPDAPPFRGLLRVRNLNADDVYEKFQIVVRRNPYELRYSDLHVWAVKPDNMVSDIIARSLAENGVFTAVTRELGDSRPDFTLGGELHAIEIYDSNEAWFAHLAMTLTLTRFSDGEKLWRFDFDMRKPVSTTSYAHAVRALSEVLASAMIEARKQLEEVATRTTTPGAEIEHGPVELVRPPEVRREEPREEPPPEEVREEEPDPELDPILVPEKRR